MMIAAAALAWLLNLIEWFFWSHTCTYTLVVVLLLVAFSAQGLTFMIYGQREFCFDDQVAGDCQIEFGAYMAIAATAAFYSAAIVWCCMPRNPPFCVGQPPPKANKGEDDENEFYGAHTRAMLQDDEDADYNNYGNTAPKELEPSSVYDQGASENVGWADSNNRGGIPQRSADDKDYYKHNSNPPPMAPVVESPPAEWDTPPSHDRSIDWIANNNNGDLLASSSQDPAGDDFDNPFLLDDSNLPPEDPAHRPAYGNLQG